MLFVVVNIATCDCSIIKKVKVIKKASVKCVLKGMEYRGKSKLTEWIKG